MSGSTWTKCTSLRELVVQTVRFKRLFNYTVRRYFPMCQLIDAFPPSTCTSLLLAQYETQLLILYFGVDVFHFFEFFFVVSPVSFDLLTIQPRERFRERFRERERERERFREREREI